MKQFRIHYWDWTNIRRQEMDDSTNLTNKFGIIMEAGIVYVNFSIIDQSKFTLFMLEYPEYIKEIIPYE